MNTKPLTRIKRSDLYWIDAAGTKHEGNCSGLRGNCSGLRGNCSDLSGDCSDIPLDARPCGLTDWTEEP